MKLFGKWDLSEVRVSDPGLERYINLRPVYVPHSSGRHTKKQFWKSKMSVVERLVNKVMRSGPGTRKIMGKFIRGRKACGKKIKAMKIVEKAFEIIEKKTRENPVQVLVRAIENAAPREEITRVTFGGITYPIAVDCSPQRRVDLALRNIALGAFGRSFRNPTPIEECLAEEIILASKYDMKSHAISRKEEIERIARSAR